MAHRELRRATAEDHEAILHLREPDVLVVTLSGVCCFLLGIVLRLTASGEVAPHHGALLQGVLRQAPMIGAWLLEHLVKNS
jgi:hypothetical protein